MSIRMERQILITRSALAMLTDVHNFKTRLTFPHKNRTGLSEAQVFELLSGVDPTFPYYIKQYTTTTTAEEDGSFNWTFLPEYVSKDPAELAAFRRDADRAVSFLSGKLFQEPMADYVKVYRACSFLAGYLTYEKDAAGNPHLHNPYGALIRGSCACQGYALALQLLLRAACVPCMVLSGSVLREKGAYSGDRFDYDVRTKTTRHYWNLVGIETTGGLQYFHVDVCWDQTDGRIGFSYFLKDDRTMQRCLKWDADAYPPCRVLPGDDVRALLQGAV